ncbi:MAG: molybdenum cofactor guanylyltransferase [Bryobacterales bacterium]|nr:molybdenum cofactor guanylyltransferase [Bryobacterales bacterium]
MDHAGYVLAGGRSSRMGRDKALLPFESGTLLEHMAQVVRQAAGNVTLVGPTERYAHLGIRIIEDHWPGCGPLAGIHAALLDSMAEWALIVACDLPFLRPDLLSWMLTLTSSRDEDVLLATLDGVRPEPLCGLYRKRAAEVVGMALEAGNFKVTNALAPLRVTMLPVADTRQLVNVNTPAEWQEVAPRGND